MTNFLKYKTLLLSPKRFDCSTVPKCSLPLLSMAQFPYDASNVQFFIRKNDELSVITKRYIHKAKKLRCSHFFYFGTFGIFPHSVFLNCLWEITYECRFDNQFLEKALWFWPQVWLNFISWKTSNHIFSKSPQHVFIKFQIEVVHLALWKKSFQSFPKAIFSFQDITEGRCELQIKWIKRNLVNIKALLMCSWFD